MVEILHPEVLQWDDLLHRPWQWVSISIIMSKMSDEMTGVARLTHWICYPRGYLHLVFIYVMDYFPL